MNGILKRPCLRAFGVLLLSLSFCSCKIRTSSGILPEPPPLDASVVVTTLWADGIPPGVDKLDFYFYPEEGGAATVRTGISASGFSGVLPPGQYRVIAWNAGAANVVAADMNRYETACVAVGFLPGGLSGLSEPSAVYAFCGDVNAREGETTRCSLTARPLTQVVSMRVKNHTGMALSSVSCDFPGIVPGCYLSHAEDPCRVERNCFQPVSALFEDNVADLSFRTFGVFNPASSPEAFPSLSLKLESAGGEDVPAAEVSDFGRLLGDALGDAPFSTGPWLDLELELSAEEGTGCFVITVGIRKWEDHDDKIEL